MDLFEYAREQNMDRESPLASRLRPETLEEVVGQQHIIGKDKLLYRAIKADKLGSLIFYREDYPCQGHRPHHEGGVHPDQRHSGGKERHGGGGPPGEGAAGNVRPPDHPLCG